VSSLRLRKRRIVTFGAAQDKPGRPGRVFTAIPQFHEGYHAWWGGRRKVQARMNDRNEDDDDDCLSFPLYIGCIDATWNVCIFDSPTRRLARIYFIIRWRFLILWTRTQYRNRYHGSVRARFDPLTFYSTQPS
jgi:hypothetical protein